MNDEDDRSRHVNFVTLLLQIDINTFGIISKIDASVINARCELK